ncbi:MAG: queuosine precursor transporter [Treponema sp.]|nr:queuosine precursor transporter [Treponema sp.]
MYDKTEEKTSYTKSFSSLHAYKYFDIFMTGFVVVLVLSNIASSAKIVDLGFSVFSIDMVFDGGTLFFPFAYILGDIVTEVYGFKAAKRMIWTGFAALAFTALIFFILSALPGELSWEVQDAGIAGTVAYNVILGGISSGGIVLASLAGYLAGEFSNAVLLVKIKNIMKGRMFWFRAVISSLAGELLDSLAFVSIACLTGVFGWELFFSLTLTNYVLKCLIEVLVLPITNTVVRRLTKKK